MELNTQKSIRLTAISALYDEVSLTFDDNETTVADIYLDSASVELKVTVDTKGKLSQQVLIEGEEYLGVFDEHDNLIYVLPKGTD